MISSSSSILPSLTNRFFSRSSAMLSRIAPFTARWQISVMSAPEKPWVAWAMDSTSTSSATGLFRSAALKMLILLWRSGSGM